MKPLQQQKRRFPLLLLVLPALYLLQWPVQQQLLQELVQQLLLL